MSEALGRARPDAPPARATQGGTARTYPDQRRFRALRGDCNTQPRPATRRRPGPVSSIRGVYSLKTRPFFSSCIACIHVSERTSAAFGFAFVHDERALAVRLARAHARPAAATPCAAAPSIGRAVGDDGVPAARPTCQPRSCVGFLLRSSRPAVGGAGLCCRAPVLGVEGVGDRLAVGLNRVRTPTAASSVPPVQ